MVVSKKTVNFDVEPRPSAEASPPPLLLGHFPSLVSLKDVADLRDSPPLKSILKNFDSSHTAYDSLCNILIDQPPPPCKDLLSLDVLQQETVFTPKKAFANLVAVDLIDVLQEENKEVEEIECKKVILEPLETAEVEDDGSIFDVSFKNPESTEQFLDTLVAEEAPEDISSISEVYTPDTPEHEAIWTINDENTLSNVRKLDDVHDELLDDFEIAVKRNKVADDSLDSSSSAASKKESEKQKEETSSEILGRVQHIEGAADTEIVSTITFETEDQGQYLVRQDTDHKIDDVLEPNNTNRSETIEENELTSQVIAPLESEIIIKEPDVAQNLASYSDETSLLNEKNAEFGVYSPSLTEPEKHKETNPQLLVSMTSVPCDSINATLTNTAQETSRRRRKSGRKGHRKHSHSKKQAPPPSQLTDSTFLTSSSVPKDSEQRALDAQAKFKRYLAKMSAAATTENLNCAGEPETLEPHMRDSIKESQILIWIYNMIDEAARVDFEFFLKDGCILCKLMNRIVPGCIPPEEITWEGARSKQKNIANFLREAEKYGVPKAKLFFPEDLLHLRHLPRVTRCIYALAKIAQSDPALGADIPQLGDEPSFLKEGPTKVVIPGHRDTKEVLAQLTSSKEQEQKTKTKHSLYK